MEASLLYVTPGGLAQITQQKVELSRGLKKITTLLREAYAAHNEDAVAMALADRLALETRLSEVESRLRRARLVKKQAVDRVQLGSSVSLQTEDGVRNYTVVDSLEIAPGTLNISADSPLGKALMGHHSGEEISVQVPLKQMRFRILSIS